jgi:glucose/mannose-6-phosphate isomerase
MLDLDDRALYAATDKSDMRGQIRGLPAQCRQAWEKALEFKLPRGYSNIDKVLILGMGGSAIGGDLLKALASNLKKPLVLVNRDYDLPAWVDGRTLVIAASYSGNTEETLSAFTQALSISCKKLVISTGGKISTLASAHKVPVFTITHVSQPRAALGYGLLPLLAIMRNMGFLDSKAVDMDGMVASLEGLTKKYDVEVPVPDNPAKKLALQLHGKGAVIYGAGILSDVARRWKTQINENSKAWAFFEVFPELNHNAIVGCHHPDALKDKLFVILLRCPSLLPRTLLRYEVTAELLRRSGIPHEFVDSEGNGPFITSVTTAELQRDPVGSDLRYVMSSVLLGDWVSFYLAVLNGVDPTPVSEIDFLKKRLADVK